MIDLTELEELTNEAIEIAKDKKHIYRDDAINWGDFQCVDRGAKVTRDFVSVFVTVSEAGIAPKVCSFISNYLSAKGFKDIEVETEW